MRRIALTLAALGCLGSSAAVAQVQPPGLPGGQFPPGTIIQRQTNTTGNTVDYIIAPGPTGRAASSRRSRRWACIPRRPRRRRRPHDS